MHKKWYVKKIEKKKKKLELEKFLVQNFEKIKFENFLSNKWNWLIFYWIEKLIELINYRDYSTREK